MSHRMNFFRRFAICLGLVIPWLTGCAAFHPMKGVPARYIPDDLKVGRRNGMRTIDLSLLSQKWNGVHLVDSGDILGIYIGGILGKIDENPLVQIPQNSDYQPSAGTPVTVREDGTISLPMISALLVRGLTVRQTESAIRDAYTNHETGKEYLQPGKDRILVSLLRPRHTHVMVVRQDSRNEPMTNAAVGQLNIGTAKRGTGKVVSLPAYRNDVLNALVATDGLPGLDAENAVYIIRRQTFPGMRDLPCPPEVDPAAIIRQSKNAETPSIRGQNYDGWDYRAGGQNRNTTSYSNPNADYRQSPQNSTASFVNNNTLIRGWSNTSNINGNDEGRIPNREVPENPVAGQAMQPAIPEAAGVSPTAYQGSQPFQSAQPWGFENGFSQRWMTNDPQLKTGTPTLLSSSNTPQAYATQPPPVPPSSVGVPQDSANLTATPNSMPPSPGFNSSANSTAPSNSPYFSGPGYSPQESPQWNRFDQNPAPVNSNPPNFELPQNFNPADISLVDGRRIIRIPIRLGPDEHINIVPEDVILNDGDIVFIESRDTEVFFTGGLLGGGQYTLPRDKDLDILQALSIATSRAGAAGAARQVGGVTALNSDVTISPSNVIVIRKLPEGGEIPIKIDLYQARSDLSERLIIQPGDYVYLQYTPLEAVGAFIDRHLLEGALFGVFAAQLNQPR